MSHTFQIHWPKSKEQRMVIKKVGPPSLYQTQKRQFCVFKDYQPFPSQKKKKNYQRFSFSSPPPSKPNCVKEFISSLRISNLYPKRLSIYYTRHSLNSLFFIFYFFIFPSSLFSTEVATSFSPFLRSFFILLITCSFSISLKNISFQTFVSCSRTNKILHQNPAYCPFFI